jgi:hypothetical protein
VSAGATVISVVDATAFFATGLENISWMFPWSFGIGFIVIFFEAMIAVFPTASMTYSIFDAQDPV